MSDPLDPLDHLRLPVIPVEPRAEFAAALLRRIEQEDEPPSGRGATVRYFVDDLDNAVDFYRDLLGFEEELRPSPTFAMLYRGDLRLLLSVPGEPHAMPDGTLPEPGGWNRISLQVVELDATVAVLRERGVRLRNDISVGVAVRQVLVLDPAGNLIELFDALPGYHERAGSAVR
ncbi:MAG TPA: VOC family protein [Acidimicrobiales bacterium]|jgi:catechol 2,3-dioxygenase-like lactoylglutathione lyase family enzyme